MSKIAANIEAFRAAVEADILEAWPEAAARIVWNKPHTPETALPHTVVRIGTLDMGREPRGIVNVSQRMAAMVVGRWELTEDLDVLAFQTAKADLLIAKLMPAGGQIYAGVFDSPLVSRVLFNVDDDEGTRAAVEVAVEFECATDVPALED